jgi:hypothetical protein
MTSNILLTLFSSVIGVIIGALLNHLLTRKHSNAEIQKLLAETEKAKAETEKLRAEINKNSSSSTITENKESFPFVADAKHSSPSALNDSQSIASASTEVNNANVTSVSFEYKEHPSPDEIIEEINRTPLYQQDSIKQGFVGIKVRWHTKLIRFTSNPKKKGVKESANLVLVFGENTRGITCDIEIDKYPEVKILKYQHGIWVMGQISKIEGVMDVIYLSECTIKIDE